jgi:hypothetical protein
MSARTGQPRYLRLPGQDCEETAGEGQKGENSQKGQAEKDS